MAKKKLNNIRVTLYTDPYYIKIQAWDGQENKITLPIYGKFTTFDELPEAKELASSQNGPWNWLQFFEPLVFFTTQKPASYIREINEEDQGPLRVISVLPDADGAEEPALMALYHVDGMEWSDGSKVTDKRLLTSIQYAITQQLENAVLFPEMESLLYGNRVLTYAEFDRCLSRKTQIKPVI